MSTVSSTFVEHAGRYGEMIEAALAARCYSAGGCPPRLGDAMRYSLLAPGKRLRPILVLMGAEACGGEIDRAMPAACAVEMIHAYSLIHDDLPAMDDDALRRGRPTCHRQFDEATAILAGDALQARAFEVLATEITPPATAAACCAVLAKAAGRCQLVGGQADDMDPPDVERLESCEALRRLEAMHVRKTGALIRASLALGALTAGADADRRAALERYGQGLGLAFQITDDLLDVVSNEKALGKQVGKDAEHGKFTFPALLGIEASRHRAERLVEDACAALATFGPAAAGLESLARFVLDRNR